MTNLPQNVLNLWCVKIRGLGMSPEERTPLTWHIATKAISERDVVAQARQRFTSKWWDEHIITDVCEIGKLHVIEGKALYERD